MPLSKTFLALLLSCAALVTLLTPGVAAADEPAKPKPGVLLDSVGRQKFIAKFHAEGVQQYECNGKEWIHKGPSAVLYDGVTGKPIGTHFSCESCTPEPGKPPAEVPAWSFFDGGRAEGSVRDKIDSKNKGAVPQLLLKLEGNGKGKTGEADHVLRLNTSGGIAPPKKDCATPQDKGKWIPSPYQADYEFRNSQLDDTRTDEEKEAARPRAKKPGSTVEAK
ncbi:MAG: DUF3455 domain-containing protein [Deltaproteobacteria bacterium]|nr:DUF3455 domain-containing protein [Deltaproteobacteria bacterium]